MFKDSVIATWSIKTITGQITNQTKIGSFTKPTSEYLSLTNTSNTPLAFKVKTTAPKLYCVRPNASIIEPGNSIKISIILQGFSQPLPEDYKCKDKFLLVSLPCPDLDDASKLSDYWPSLEAKYKQQLVQKKLRVNYVIGEDVEDSVAGDNGADSQREFQPQQGELVWLEVVLPDQMLVDLVLVPVLLAQVLLVPVLLAQVLLVPVLLVQVLPMLAPTATTMVVMSQKMSVLM